MHVEPQSDTHAADLFTGLLHAATQAHILHFRTKSYAAHKALGGLYEDLPELVDKLVEAYQGLHGVIEDYPTYSVAPTDDAVKFVQACRTHLQQNRASVGKESELQNIVDEIAALLNTTLYKLKNLS